MISKEQFKENAIQKMTLRMSSKECHPEERHSEERHSAEWHLVILLLGSLSWHQQGHLKTTFKIKLTKKQKVFQMQL